MSRLNRKRFQTHKEFEEAAEDINPMNYLGNLSDAMLVLAVGIMIAVVFAFKVNLADVQAEAERKAAEAQKLEEQLENIRATTDEETVDLKEGDLTEYGTVYMDADGTLYVVEN